MCIGVLYINLLTRTSLLSRPRLLEFQGSHKRGVPLYYMVSFFSDQVICFCPMFFSANELVSCNDTVTNIVTAAYFCSLAAFGVCQHFLVVWFLFVWYLEHLYSTSLSAGVI